jgi:hypothetical protein
MTHFGAECIIVPGDYDDAYKKCADDCVAKGDRGLLVQDTSWEGYEDIPMVRLFPALLGCPIRHGAWIHSLSQPR